MAARRKTPPSLQSLPTWAYKTIMEQLHEGVIIASTDNNLRLMNRAAAAIYGYDDPSQFESHLHNLTKLFTLYTYPGRRQVADHNWPIRQLQAGRTSVHRTYFVKRLDTGAERVVEYNGKRIQDNKSHDTYVMLNLRDVTAEKQIELERAEHLRQSQIALAKVASDRQQLEKLAAFFQSALDAIIILDQKGLITEFNPAAERIFGYRRKQALGQELAALIIPPRYRDAHRKGLQRYLTAGVGPILGKRVEVNAIRRNGEEFPVELFVTRIGTSDPPTFMGTLRDITDLRNSQELEKRAALLAEQREQLLVINQAKDEFISVASHQLRTPATGVKQYIGMLLQGFFGEPSEEQSAMLQAAYDSNERQLFIINALLNVARLDAGKVTLKPVACNLGQLIEEIASEQAAVFKVRQQTLSLSMPRKPVMAQVDMQLLRMVIENIIDNAGKYSPEGKAIEIDLTCTDSHATIAVTDHGVGIRKADRTKLFQKFSRIDNELPMPADGSGLGLYWAKKIVDLHRGHIEVTSKAKQGSTFRIILPL
jgi:PAS domain S-box-containing protein